MSTNRFLTIAMLFFVGMGSMTAQQDSIKRVFSASISYDPFTVYNICFSHDSKYLAFSHEKGGVHIHDMSTRSGTDTASQATQTLCMEKGDTLNFHTQTRKELSALVFHPQKNVLMAGFKSGELYAYDVEKKTVLKVFNAHSKAIVSLVYHNGLLYSGGRDNLIKVWDENGKLVKTINTVGNPNSIKFKGPLLYYHNGNLSKAVRSINIEENYEYQTFEEMGTIEMIELTKNGDTLLAVGLMKDIYFMDTETKETVRILGKHQKFIKDITFNSKYNMFATSSDDNTMAVWSYPDCEVLFDVPLDGDGHKVAFSPNSKYVACLLGDFTIEVYEFF